MAVDWASMSDDELLAESAAANAETGRRRKKQSIPAQVAALNAQYLAVDGVEQGLPWRQPTGAHDAYPKGWLVLHGAGTWESLVDANVWEPPLNWREQVPEGQHPAWVQPTGASDAYPLGARVTHNAAVWESDLDANVWEPGVHGWTAIEGGA